jgi:uncharacterized protein (DUF952 family)
MKSFPILLYKLVPKKTWHTFLSSGQNVCYGFENDIDSGFVHMSTFEQLPQTIKKYRSAEEYRDLNRDLNILGIYLRSDEVKWERSCKLKKINIHSSCTGGNCKMDCQEYPHLYGPIKYLPIQTSNILFVMDLDLFMKKFGMNKE